MVVTQKQYECQINLCVNITYLSSTAGKHLRTEYRNSARAAGSRPISVQIGAAQLGRAKAEDLLQHGRDSVLAAAPVRARG